VSKKFGKKWGKIPRSGHRLKTFIPFVGTSMKTCKIYAILPQTRSLGPYLRYAIWLQGCNKNCHECMTPEARPNETGTIIPVNDIANAIIHDPKIEGITISGGEPFLQPTAMIRLIERIKLKRDIGVIVYTGYTYDELMEGSLFADKKKVHEFCQHIDILIDGPYIKSLNDGLSLRGSSNQNIHVLSNRYKSVVDQYYRIAQRNVELHMMNNDIFLAGIPGKEMLMQWQDRFVRS